MPLLVILVVVEVTVREIDDFPMTVVFPSGVTDVLDGVVNRMLTL